MKKFALAVWLVALPAALFAGSGQGVSGNSTVDTRAFFGSGITITFHRASGTVLENANKSAGVDAPLWVDATKSASLGTQEALVPDASGHLGLVADGVTPLLVKISASGDLPQGGQTFELNVSTKGGESFSGSVPIRIVEDISCRPKVTFTLTPSRRTAFAVIGPVDADRITSRVFTWLELRGKTASTKPTARPRSKPSGPTPTPWRRTSTESDSRRRTPSPRSWASRSTRLSGRGPEFFTALSRRWMLGTAPSMLEMTKHVTKHVK